MERIQASKAQFDAYAQRYIPAVRSARLTRILFVSMEQKEDKASRWISTYVADHPSTHFSQIRSNV